MLTFFHSFLPVLEPANSNVKVSIPSDLKSSIGIKETDAVPSSSILKLPTKSDTPRSPLFVTM